MITTWLIEKDVHEDGTCEKLESTVKELGGEVQWFRYPGFDAPIEPKNLPLGFLGPVIVYEPGANCLTMVSTPSTIEAEWRLVIADKKVVAGSQYKLNGGLFIDGNYPSGVAAFAEKIANAAIWASEPHPIYVMDICSVPWNGGSSYYLLEIGSVNCAGLYGLDMKAVVQAANVIAEREFVEVNGED